MALLFADGFEDGSAGWALVSAMTVGTGRLGNGLVAGGTNSQAKFPVSPQTAGPYIAGCAFKAGAGSDSYNIEIACFESTTPGSSHIGLQRGPAGQVQAVRQYGTVIGSSATGVLPIGVWVYVEFKTVIHDTTGYIVVRVNGVEVLNLTNIDTKVDGAVTPYFVIGSTLVGSTYPNNAWDDFYLLDTTGSYNNDFLGELVVEHFRPASDDTAQFVGSDGNSTSNYALVDEAGAVDTADYVQSATVGQRDLYVPVPSARAAGSAVYGVVVLAHAQKTDVSTRSVKLCVKEGSGGTVRQGAEVALLTTPVELRATFERKGDGSQFTIADVNALRLGYEVTA